MSANAPAYEGLWKACMLCKGILAPDGCHFGSQACMRGRLAHPLDLSEPLLKSPNRPPLPSFFPTSRTQVLWPAKSTSLSSQGMVKAQLGTPVTPQKGATLEGAGAALACLLARAGTLAAAERSRDRLAKLSLHADKGLLFNDLCKIFDID